MLRIEWNVGNAEVYTLTVATDHTFFVGDDGVLVHNSICPVSRPPGSDWDITNVRARGRTIEAQLLPPGNVITSRTYPVIDSFVRSTGEAESIKSIDLTSPFYQTASNLRGKLNYYSRQLDAFFGIDYAGVDTTGSVIRSKTMVFVFEPNVADAAQQGVINGFIYSFASKYPQLHLRIQYLR